MNDLIDQFGLCVYDETRRRYELRAGPVTQVPGLDLCFYLMWVDIPHGVPNLYRDRLLVQFRYEPGTYLSRTHEERTAQAYRFASLFCVFVHGVVLGWETIERDVEIDGGLRDQISVDDYTRQDDIDNVLRRFELDDSVLRSLCREELLAFGVHDFQQRGVHSSWKIDDFLASGCRLPYNRTTAHDIMSALMHERKLKGSFGDPKTGRTAYLDPEKFEDEQEKGETRIRSWIEWVRSVGEQNKWIPLLVGENAVAKEKPKDSRKVFVVHGRDGRLRDSMFQFLRAINLHPLEWSEAVALTRKASPYVGEVLEAAFAEAAAVVVLFTPDDEARLRELFWRNEDNASEKELMPQARPNVLFEAGMAMGRDPDRTVLVEVGRLRPFSDVGGRHVIRLDNTTEKRQDLAKRLESAGCQVSLDGTDWHKMGDFS